MTAPTLSPDLRAWLAGELATALVRSPFRKRGRWRDAVVILDGRERRVTSRADFAGWCAANALPSLAREALNRKIAPGHVLVWLGLDSADGAFAGFRAFDLASALRETGEPS